MQQSRWLVIVVVVGGVVIGRAVAARADGASISQAALLERLESLEQEVKMLKRQVELNQEQASAKTQETASSAPAWKWSGDIRLREEARNRTGTGQDVHRQRIRFRYGFDAKVTDDLKVGARLATGNTATGSSNAISTNQSLNVAFNHVNIVLDRAYATWTPTVPGLTECKLTGGIIENPFWTLGQLVWDEDLNFQGGAVRLAKTLGPVTLFSTNGVFALQTDVSKAASLWSSQGGVIYKPFAEQEDELRKNLKITTAVAYHDYKNVTRTQGKNTALTTAGGTKGNSASLKDVNLLNPAVEIASQYADVPFSGFGDVVHNTGAAVKNNGFQVGLKIGKARVPFDLKKGWEGGWYFERLENDATLGAFSDSDFGNGGTNHRGNVYWLKLAVLKNTVIGLKYFNTRQIIGIKNKADTVQMDWVTTF